MTEEELDRETERLFAAARREKPAGVLRERVMRGVARGERARAKAQRLATFGWAAVAAGVGGLVWLGASAMSRAPNLGAEPERAGALNPVPEMPSVQAAPSVSVAPAPAPSLVAPASASVAPRATVRAATPRSAPLPSVSAAVPRASSAPVGIEPPAPSDLSKAMEERK